MVERLTYRDALRAKGVPPLPPYAELRTRKDDPPPGGQVELFTPRGERPEPEVYL